MKHWSRFSLVAALLAALFAGPADAQQRDRGKQKQELKERWERVLEQRERERGRPELRRRDDVRWDEPDARRKRGEDRDDWDEDWDDDREDEWEEEWEDADDDDDGRWRAERGRRGVPPGWCRGRGNPHNTPENCGPRSDRRGDERWERSGDRGGGWDEGRDRRRSASGSSLQRAHHEFHLRHDRQCQMRAAERPLDIAHQIRIRTACKADHDAWHRRAGVGHEELEMRRE